MAKQSKDRDRRAVVEQMRKDQKRSERRLTVAVIVACAVVAVVIIGAAAVPLLRQGKVSAQPLTEIGAAASAAGCETVVKKKATGNQQHEAEGTPITYPDSPPAFGPHYPVTAGFSRKFYSVDDRPKLEYLVHNLEHGYSLLWYDDTVANDKKKLAEIKAIASKYEGTKLTDKFIALPWTAQDGKGFPEGMHVALTHWSSGGDSADPAKQQGIWQYCAQPSGQVVKTFTKDYPYSDSPEPQAM